MKLKQTISVVALLSLCLTSLQLIASVHNVSSTAHTVHLRTSCIEGVSPQTVTANCFTTMAELEDWIELTRQPDASSPLQVIIAPGRYGGFTCPDNSSHISFNGAGPENTFIGNLETSAWGIQTHNNLNACTEFSASNLTAEGFFWGVLWTSNGNSRWTNVTMRGNGYGWFDYNCPANTLGTHYFFSSRIISTGGTASSPFAVSKGYGSNCGKNWFFATEIFATGRSSQGVKGLYVNNGEAHVYGGVIRVHAGEGVDFVDAGTSNLNPSQQEGIGMFAVLSANSSDIHIHGTGIDVIGNSRPNNVAALIATSGGSIHANESSYNLKTGAGGNITRIMDENTSPGLINAPYLWSPRPNPPAIVSTSGSDMAVINSSGTRFVIYNEACTSKWFDVGNNACTP